MGTALLLADVGPMPGTGYVLNKYLLDEIRDKRGWGKEVGGKLRPSGVSAWPPETPSLSSPQTTSIPAGVFCPLLCQPSPTPPPAF